MFLALCARILFVLAAYFPLTTVSIFAEQLAVKNFSISEGLARNQTSVIYPDSRGFVWVGTADGLSHFDGYGFTNYTTRNGLPHPVISGILEDENGFYWVATHGGLSLVNFNSPLDEKGALDIKPVKLGESEKHTVFSIFRDNQNILWAGTRDGLYKITKNGDEIESRRVSLGLSENARREGISGIIKDAADNLWFANPDGLFRLDAAGEVKKFNLDASSYFDKLGNIIADREGRLWIGGLNRLYVFKPPLENEETKPVRQMPNEIKLPENAGEFSVFDQTHGLADERILKLFLASDNQIWIGSRKGVSLFDGEKFRKYTAQNGLISEEILCFGEDYGGNIWIGTESTGVMRVARNGFTTFTTADGLPENRISSVFQGADGEIYVSDSRRNLSRFTNGGFVTVRPAFPSNVKEFGWSWQKPVLQDKRGEWWFASAQGVVRFPAVKKIEELAFTQPVKVYDSQSGLPGNQVYRLFEDREGNIWVSNFSPPSSGISKIEPMTGKTETFLTDSQNQRKNLSAYSFAEDSSGNLWLGLNNGGLAQYKNGKIEILENVENLPKTNIYDILADKNGNFWLATGTGAYLVENPASENPAITPLTVEQGLATNDVIAVTDDAEGRIYFATSQGINRYHPQNKQIELFTTADGIANSELRTALRSRDGSLWFGTIRGLTRFNPADLKKTDASAPILIRSVKIGGEPFPVSELGAETIGDLEVLPHQTLIEIEVLGMSLKSGDILKYQYKLDDEQDWSAPTAQRQFTFVNLSAGNYEFRARAVNADGLVSASPVSVKFTVLAPFYLRWWFLCLAAAAVAIPAYALYRSRLKRLLELEKVRHNIATDLHDDIGSSLSQISLISEVLSLSKNGKNTDEKEALETIAKTSREAVGSMSEMVWAINPKRDNLIDTVQRMRRFASDTLSAADIRFTFETSDFDKNSKIDADARRHLYLIYKEIINNAVKHSEASKIEIRFTKSAKFFTLEVCDNGRGFRADEAQTGNGLQNIRLRAEKIGGTIAVVSAPDEGTSVKLVFPSKSGVFGQFST